MSDVAHVQSRKKRMKLVKQHGKNVSHPGNRKKKLQNIRVQLVLCKSCYLLLVSHGIVNCIPHKRLYEYFRKMECVRWGNYQNALWCFISGG